MPLEAHQTRLLKGHGMQFNRMRMRFPTESKSDDRAQGGDLDPLSCFDEETMCDSSLRALAAVEDTSRRIDDLARRLGCLGFFETGDGPRAA